MTEKLFNEIAAWQQETFPGGTPDSTLHHLINEIRELRYALRLDPASAGEELADCMFLIFGCADRMGMSYQDIQDAIAAKFEKNKARKWGQPDANGVVKHVEEPSVLIASPGEGAVVVEPTQPNIECVYSGIQCDNPDCDYRDDTVTVDQWESFIGKPCPKCGENLMTEEDLKNAMNLVYAAEFMNSLTPEQLIQLYEELGSHSIDDMKNHPMIKDAEGLDLLKSLDQQVVLKYNTHKEIKLESVVPVDQPSQPITLPANSTDMLMDALRKSEIN